MAPDPRYGTSSRSESPNITDRDRAASDPWTDVIMGAIKATLSVASDMSSDRALRGQMNALPGMVNTQLAQLNQATSARIADRRRRADQILGTLRVAGGAAGVTPQESVLRQIDAERARGDQRDRQSFANNRLAIITQSMDARNRLGAQRLSELEIALNSASAFAS